MTFHGRTVCSVGVCIKASDFGSMLGGYGEGVRVLFLVDYFIGVCSFRPCAPLAAAGTPRSQPTQWEVCCPCGS